MKDAGELEKFDEITFLEYRGYIISISAYGLSTPDPEVKYQIFQSREFYDKDLDLYDSLDTMHLREDFEEVIRQAREWVDMYETFHGWI